MNIFFYTWVLFASFICLLFGFIGIKRSESNFELGFSLLIAIVGVAGMAIFFGVYAISE